MANLTLNISETVKIKDEVRRPLRGIVSDIGIKNNAMTLAEFGQKLNAGSANGYSDFAQFIVGDYSYSKAIFKMTAQSGDGSSPRITSLAVDVDVPDMFERGTTTTSNIGYTHVSFTRQFSVVTEVIATQNGGTSIAAPNVVNVTNEGFDVELLNVTSARVIGDVSWAARGY